MSWAVNIRKQLINQFTSANGDYMAERNALFAGMKLDQIIADIKHAKPVARAPTEGIEGKPQE